VAHEYLLPSLTNLAGDPASIIERSMEFAFAWYLSSDSNFLTVPWRRSSSRLRTEMHYPRSIDGPYLQPTRKPWPFGSVLNTRFSSSSSTFSRFVCRSMIDLRASRINVSLYSVRHIPTWLPGAGFKKEAARVHKLVDHIRFTPWEVIPKDIVRRVLINGCHMISEISCVAGGCQT
jgi:hypothetical protein